MHSNTTPTEKVIQLLSIFLENYQEGECSAAIECGPSSSSSPISSTIAKTLCDILGIARNYTTHDAIAFKSNGSTVTVYARDANTLTRFLNDAPTEMAKKAGRINTDLQSLTDQEALNRTINYEYTPARG